MGVNNYDRLEQQRRSAGSSEVGWIAVRVDMRTNKKRKGKSVWTISGGSTGLVQQKKSSYKSKTLDKRKRIPPIIENPDYVNNYASLIDAIKRIKSQEWLDGKWINKSSTNKDKHKTRLYRKLNGNLKRCMNLNPDFKSTKLYKDALSILKNYPSS